MRYLPSLLLAVSITVSILPAQSPSALESDPKGWKNVLPPKNFKGWQRRALPPLKELNAESQWHIKDGMLICDGDKGHEWLISDKDYEDFIWHVEWRFPPMEGNPRYNSGLFVRSLADYTLWYQVQTGPIGGFLFGHVPDEGGKTKRITMQPEMKDNRVKPAGEWNVTEVRAAGGKITSWLNGAVVSEFPNCPVLKGRIGFEAEGFRIEFRNVKIKALKAARIR